MKHNFSELPYHFQITARQKHGSVKGVVLPGFWALLGAIALTSCASGDYRPSASREAPEAMAAQQ